MALTQTNELTRGDAGVKSENRLSALTSRENIFNLTAVLFVITYLYQGIVGISSPAANRSLFICFGAILIFINKPLKGRLAILDVFAVAGAIVGTVYFNANYDRYLVSFGLPLNTMDVIIGSMMLLLIVEMARRQLGWVMAGLSILAVVYLVFGRSFPGAFAHAGFSWNDVVSELYASVTGIYGEVTYILANCMLLFLVFGAFLNVSGAGDFYLDLSKSLLGRKTGGCAKAAVVSSFIVGSVTGSAAGNVAITGTLTIPLMKRTGYEAHVAGATEAAASTGGTILPPVMGAAAFVMAAIIGRSYAEVIAVAAIPGVIYFISVLAHTHFYASRRGIGGLSEDQLPDVKTTLRKGVQFFLPIIVMIYSLSSGFSLTRAGLLSIASVFVASSLRKETRMSFRTIANALISGAKTALPIVAVAGPVSMVSQALVLPGMAVKFTGQLVTFTGGQLGLTLVVVALVAYVLGMGLDSTAAYLVMATFAPPALVQLGVPLLPAHLLAMWFGQLSNVTPPVAMAAYVASSISEANMWKVGMTAARMALALLYLPIVWVYRPALVLQGSVFAVLLTSAIVLAGVVLLVAAEEGYLLGPMKVWQRVAAGFAAFMLLIPFRLSDILGVAIGVLLIADQLRARRKTLPSAGL